MCIINTLKSTRVKVLPFPFPAPPLPSLPWEDGWRGVTSKQIKKIISMAHGTLTEDDGNESSKQKADNGIKCAA